MVKVYFKRTINKKTDIMTHFYLLPTIEYFRDKLFDDDGDYSFDIIFGWLFWMVTITRYWGNSYGKHKSKEK